MTLDTKVVAYENEFFVAEYANSCFLPGYLILLPKTPVTGIYDLEEPALAAFGKTIALLHEVLNQVMQPDRIYTLSFSEQCPTLHFHIFPRTQALLEDFRKKTKPKTDLVHGPQLFEWSREEYKDKPFGDYDKVMEELNAAFSSALL